MTLRLIFSATLASLIATSLLLAPPHANAHKSDDESEIESGRFTLLETKDGVLRLDKRNGTIDTCVKKENEWQCRPITDNSRDYKPEDKELDQESQDIISELRLKNLKLKQRIADLEAQQNLNSPDADGKFKREEKSLKLPTDEEVDEAISYMERMIRKFSGAMERLRKERQEEAPGTEL